MDKAFNHNDGGRLDAGRKGSTGDCVARAIAIAAQLPYEKVYADLAAGNATQRRGKYESKSKAGKATASRGINTGRKWFKDYMTGLGFEWHSTMGIGTGCTVHLKADELPAGRIIATLSRHWCAVIDGVINDIYDPSRGGTRCVYGYWVYKG